MLIISQEKRKSLDDPGTSVRPKRLKVSEGHSTRNIYPKECNLCKRYRIKGLEDTYSLKKFQHNISTKKFLCRLENTSKNI